ncbi:MAG: tyrosine-type recombinase/integrase, partial [Vicinamibacterales bacterium]
NVATLVRRPKGSRREKPTLTQDEARALLDALAEHRMSALVTCGVSLGLRLGEVLGLQWADIDLRQGSLTVRRALQTVGRVRQLADLKSKQSNRTIALPAVVVKTLERHKVAQAERRLAAGPTWEVTDFVFTTRTGRPLDGTLTTRDLKRIAAKVWVGGSTECQHTRLRDRDCLDCGGRRLPAIGFQGLRHSCTSLLLAAGVPVRDVSELLGHSDIRLTLTNYAHVLDASRTRMAGLIDRVFTAEIDGRTDSQTYGHR